MFIPPPPSPHVLLSAAGGGVRGEDAVRLPWFQPLVSCGDGRRGWVRVCELWFFQLWGFMTGGRRRGREEERKRGGEEEREDRRKEVLKGGGGLMSLQRVIVSSVLQKSEDDKKLHLSVIFPSSLLHHSTSVSAHGQLKEGRRQWKREGRSEGDCEWRIKGDREGGMEGVWVLADPPVSLLQPLSCFTCFMFFLQILFDDSDSVTPSLFLCFHWLCW